MSTRRKIEDILRKYRPPLSNENIDAIATEISEVVDAAVSEDDAE
jgi:hypothetical protein